MNTYLKNCKKWFDIKSGQHTRSFHVYVRISLREYSEIIHKHMKWYTLKDYPINLPRELNLFNYVYLNIYIQYTPTDTPGIG